MAAVASVFLADILAIFLVPKQFWPVFQNWANFFTLLVTLSGN